MKKFFGRLALFTCIIVLLYVVCIAVIVRIMNKDSLYRLPAGTSVLVVGNSHTAYGLDDSLLANTCNLSKSGDPFRFTYMKLRKLLPLNPGVKTVVLAISEGDITQRFKHERLHFWTWALVNDYFFLMQPSELFSMLLSDPVDVIKPLVAVPRLQTYPCIKIERSQYTMKNLKLGSYESLTNKINIKKELQKQADDTESFALTPAREISYLHQIVELCRSHHVRILFLRTPEHKLFVRKAEQMYLGLLKDQFAEVPLMDFVDMQLPDTCYIDMEHLNRTGARIFTDSFRTYFDERYSR